MPLGLQVTVQTDDECGRQLEARRTRWVFISRTIPPIAPPPRGGLRPGRRGGHRQVIRSIVRGNIATVYRAVAAHQNRMAGRSSRSGCGQNAGAPAPRTGAPLDHRDAGCRSRNLPFSARRTVSAFPRRHTDRLPHPLAVTPRSATVELHVEERDLSRRRYRLRVRALLQPRVHTRVRPPPGPLPQPGQIVLAVADRSRTPNCAPDLHTERLTRRPQPTWHKSIVDERGSMEQASPVC